MQSDPDNCPQRPKSKKKRKKALEVRKSDKWFSAESDELDSDSSNVEIQTAIHTQPMTLDKDNHVNNIRVHPKETQNHQDTIIETDTDANHLNLAPTENAANATTIPDLQCIRPANTTDTPKSRNAHTPSKEKLNGDELFICMDSNSKYLKRNMIWDTRTTIWKHTSNIYEATRAILGCSMAPKCFLIHTGVNDTDNKAAHQVAKELLELVTNIRKQFGKVRIVLSEISPRNDRVDSVVVEANAIIKRELANDKDTFLINFDRLRSDNAIDYLACFDKGGKDERHFSPQIAPRFAARLKIGIRWAFGIASRSRYSYRAPPRNPNTTYLPDLRDVQTGFHPIHHQQHHPIATRHNNNPNLKQILSTLISAIQQL